MPNYDVECDNCGVFERINWPLERRAEPCDRCGGPVQTLITSATKSKGFEAYFNYGLGEHVTGTGDINKAKRENNLRDKEPPSKGEMSARNDRINERMKERFKVAPRG